MGRWNQFRKVGVSLVERRAYVDLSAALGAETVFEGLLEEGVVAALLDYYSFGVQTWGEAGVVHAAALRRSNSVSEARHPDWPQFLVAGLS